MNDLFKDLDLTEEAKTTLSERIESELKLVREGAVNDPDFVKQIRSQEAAKFFKSNEKVIKKLFGITADEVDTDLSGLARQEALLKLGKSSLEKNKDETNQSLQEKLIQLAEEKRIFVEETHPAELQNLKQGYQTRFIDDGILKDALDIECIVGQKSKVPLVNAFLLENNLKKVWNDEVNDYQILTNDNLKFTLEGKPLEKKQIIELALDDVIKKSNGNTATTPSNNGTPQVARIQGKQEHSEEARRLAASHGVTL